MPRIRHEVSVNPEVLQVVPKGKWEILGKMEDVEKTLKELKNLIVGCDVW